MRDVPWQNPRWGQLAQTPKLEGGKLFLLGLWMSMLAALVRRQGARR